MEVSIRDVNLLCLGRLPTSGTCDQRYVVAGDKNTSYVRMWPAFKSRRTVVDDGRACTVLCCVRESSPGSVCERKLRMQHGQVAFRRHRMHDAVQTPPASIWLAASKTGRVHVRCGTNAFG